MILSKLAPRFPFLALVFGAVLVASGCSLRGADPQQSADPPAVLARSETETRQPTSRGCERQEVHCVGLAIAPSAIELRQLASGLDQVLDGGADIVEVLEAEDVTQLEYKIDDFAQEAFDVIVVSGDPSGVLVAQMAADFPGLEFVSLGVTAAQRSTELEPTTDSDGAPNLTIIEFPTRDAGFLAGSLAALTTNTAKVALVLGAGSDPAAVEFRAGFEAGAQFIDPGIELFSFFHPDGPASAYNDPMWASQRVREAIAQGVDVVGSFGGTTAGAALVEAARHDGAVRCIGSIVDQAGATPEAESCLITSSVIDIDGPLRSAVLDLLEASDDRATSDGITSDGTNRVDPVAMADFNLALVSGDIVSQMDEIIQGLGEGSILATEQHG